MRVWLVPSAGARRVAKRVYNWSGGQWVADPLEERRFVWHEWLMLEELGDPSGTGQGGAGQGGTGQCGTGYQPVMRTKQCGTGYQPVRSYTWGLDLAGLNGSVNSLQAAGGIGGLLAVHQAALDRPGTSNDVAAGDYGFTYDGNGNVVQVVDLQNGPQIGFTWHAARLMARYEYDAYGHVIGPDTNADGQFDELDDVGPYAAENPMRFSTKYFDRETGLGNWGYRYYSPALGRWVSRDPLEELGGHNLHEFVANAPHTHVDPYGLFAASCSHCEPPTSQPDSQPCPDDEYVRCRDAAGNDRDCGPDVCKAHCSKKGNEQLGGSTLCDGNGGICCCVCSDHLKEAEKRPKKPITDKDVLAAFIRCTAAHEGQHIDDLSKIKPPVCKDDKGNNKPAGAPIKGSPRGECSAYQTEFSCMAINLPKDCLSRPDCKAAMKAYVADLLTACVLQCKDQEKCVDMMKKALAEFQSGSKSK